MIWPRHLNFIDYFTVNLRSNAKSIRCNTGKFLLMQAGLNAYWLMEAEVGAKSLKYANGRGLPLSNTSFIRTETRAARAEWA